MESARLDGSHGLSGLDEIGLGRFTQQRPEVVEVLWTPPACRSSTSASASSSSRTSTTTLRRRPRLGSSAARRVRSPQARRPAPIDALGRRARSRRDGARPRASSRSTRPGDRPAFGVTVLGPRSALAPGIQERVNFTFAQCRPIPAEPLAKHRFAELGQLERQAHPLRCCRLMLHELQFSRGACSCEQLGGEGMTGR